MELRDFAMRRFPAEARGDASRTTALTDPPAAAVFFHDPDGRLLEHLAMLPHQPCPEAGVVPDRAWMAQWVRGGPASAGPAGTNGSGAR